jgi:hypothetical protein
VKFASEGNKDKIAATQLNTVKEDDVEDNENNKKISCQYKIN